MGPSCLWSYSRTKPGEKGINPLQKEGASACSTVSSLGFPAAPISKQHQGPVLELADGSVAPQGLLSWKAEASRQAALALQ